MAAAASSAASAGSGGRAGRGHDRAHRHLDGGDLAAEPDQHAAGDLGREGRRAADDQQLRRPAGLDRGREPGGITMAASTSPASTAARASASVAVGHEVGHTGRRRARPAGRRPAPGDLAPVEVDDGVRVWKVSWSGIIVGEQEGQAERGQPPP